MAELSETPPPQKRRRRRWLIVTLLLFAALACWWYYPRGDARLVGAWRMQDAPDPFVLWTFHSNGIFEARTETPAPSLRGVWKVDGDDLLLGHQWIPARIDRIVPISDWLGRATDWGIADSSRTRLGIHFPSTTELHLSPRQHHKGQPEALKLKRLPE